MSRLLIYWCVGGEILCCGEPVSFDESTEQLAILQDELTAAQNCDAEAETVRPADLSMELIDARLRARQWARVASIVRAR